MRHLIEPSNVWYVISLESGDNIAIYYESSILESNFSFKMLRLLISFYFSMDGGWGLMTSGPWLDFNFVFSAITNGFLPSWQSDNYLLKFKIFMSFIVTSK